jgi:hypothetical protein
MLSIVSGFGGIALGWFVGVAEASGEFWTSVVVADGIGSGVIWGADGCAPTLQAVSSAAAISSALRDIVDLLYFTD